MASKRTRKNALQALTRELAAARPSLTAKRAADQTALLEAIMRRLDRMERQQHLLMRQVLMPRDDQWHGKPPLLPDGGPGEMVFTRSCVCRARSFREPWFSYWCAELNQPLRYHRKLWEFVFICQALYERGLIAEGRRGLGFGVGIEPLPAYFAAHGCDVTATDMGEEEALAAGWTSTDQFAGGKARLQQAAVCLCDPEVFDRRVTFRTVDMNHVPDDLTGFDFCWSACALEHLGSIAQGFAFIERSLDALKPGGFAIHTTEYNLSSNEDTLDNAGTVLFRRRDLEGFAARMAERGHEVAPFDLHPGFGAVDRYVDAPPYLEEPHLKMALDGYATTSVGLIVRKAA